MAALQPIIEKLAKAQSGMLRAADAVCSEQWKTRPSPVAWSAAELIGHVMAIERAVLATADRHVQCAPRPVSMIRRVHLPVALSESRLFRVKTPIPLDPAMVGEKEEMLAELREVRERTLAFIDETSGRDLSVYRWRHLILGYLNLYQWMEMIAGHEVRHTKQMREIAGSLPKGVASLQK
jgi:DinB superfamily